MKSQEEQAVRCKTTRKTPRNLEKRLAVESTFSEDIAAKIMAELVRADKDVILKMYSDKDVQTEDLENRLYQLAAVSIWGTEVLCRALSEGDSVA